MKKFQKYYLLGHHKNIEAWRRKEALRYTLLKRPDLIQEQNLSDEDKKNIELLKESK